MCILGNIVPVNDVTPENKEQLKEIESASARLAASLEGQDLELAGKFAHDLKELCSSIDADELKSLAFQIELAVRRNNVKDILYSYFTFDKELICLDIMMPKVDGIKVLKAIRELGAQKGIVPEKRSKVIMTSALNGTDMVQKAFEIPVYLNESEINYSPWLG